MQTSGFSNKFTVSAQFTDEDNATTSYTQPQISYNYWTASLATCLTIIVLNILIMASFINHARNVFAKRKLEHSGKIVYKSAIAAVTVPLGRYIATLSLIIASLHTTDDMVCEVLIDIGKTLFVLSLVAIYVFYWARQRSFYKNQALAQMLGKNLGLFSKFSLVILLFIGFVMIPLSTYPNEYSYGPNGCALKNGEKTLNARFYGYCSALLTCQLIVVSLLLYPLVIHYRGQTKRSELTHAREVTSTDYAIGITSDSDFRTENTTGSPSATTSGVFRKERTAVSNKIDYNRSASTVDSTKLYKIIKRTFLLAILAIVTDSATFVITGQILPASTPQYVIRLVYDIDVFVNVIAAIASFENFLGMMSKPCVMGLSFIRR